jgi:hypothetical protein
MIFVGFLVGGFIGFGACSILSTNQYTKGYWDGYRRGHKHGYDSCKVEEKFFGVKER